MTPDQKKTSVLTALAVLQCAEGAAPKRQRTTGIRKRFVYHVPLVGQVCHGAFLLCYEISAPTVSRYRKQVEEGQFAAKPHGGRLNQNARQIDMEWIVSWYKGLADVLGETVPVCVRRYKTVDDTIVRFTTKNDMLLLPSYFTWEGLYQELKTYAELEHVNEKLPAFATFRAAMIKSCPNTRIRSPRSNVCDICAIYRSEMTKDDSADIAEKLEEHAEDAKMMRAEYQKDQAEASKTNLVLTIDYAQNLTVPSVPETPSQWYFLSLLSVSLFGMHVAHRKKHINFLYSELKGCKGPNEVISLLCRVLDVPCGRCPDSTLTIYADNCSGQNKNNFVLKFMLLLAHGGWFRETQLKFLVKGHTKNACDGGFGLIKKGIAKHEIWTLNELTKQVNGTAKSIEAASLGEEEDKSFYNYKQVVSDLYKNLRGISRYQLFRCRQSRPGVVECRRRPNDNPEEYDLRKVINGELISTETAAAALNDTNLKELPPPPRNVEKMQDVKPLRSRSVR